MPSSSIQTSRTKKPARGLQAPALPRPAPRRRLAIFTIVSRNYIAYAVTLMQSVRDAHPDAARFIVLADSYREFPSVDMAAEPVFCDEIGIGPISNMKLWYTVIEFNTAIKPFVFNWLFSCHNFGEVVYLDPDILVFRPLTEVVEGLKSHNIVLTPHIMRPLQDGGEPSDLTIMKSGVYNLGFLGVRNDPHGRSLIDWWSERCFLHCRIDIADNMFTDQRWMDLAPVFVPNPLILRHPGYNVAYWNLAHRELRRTADNAWLVNGEPLVFFHFSGIDPHDPGVFSKHQNRFTADTLGPAAALCDLYRERVLQNGWAEHARARYGFAGFANGRPIEDAMRRWFRRAVDHGRFDARSPVEIGSDFFDQADEEAAEKGAALTRFMYQFWLDRDDLRRAFDIFTPRGHAGYVDWFIDGEARKQGVDGRSIAAARRISGKPEPARAPLSARNASAPWPLVSRESWQGPSRDSTRFIEGDVVAVLGGRRILVPVQVALLWELRPDLRAHFALTTADDLYRLLSWALTSGVREDLVQCREFSDEFIRQMAAKTAGSDHYGGVPITEGLVGTRFVGSSNKCYETRHRFPVDRASRLAQGLWFAYVAAKQFGWPAALVSPLATYFEAPGAVEYDGFRLTNAILAIWELRQDVQEIYPLDRDVSIAGYLLWLLGHGLGEMDISLDQLGRGLREFLLSESPRLPGVERIFEMLYEHRLDLQNGFDLATESGRAAFAIWCRAQAANPRGEPVIDLLLGRTALANVPEPPVRAARVALTGEWSIPSGLGEVLRSSAASLRAAGFSDFVIVDTEAHTVLRPDGSPLPENTRVEVEINVVHRNADTAYADWRLLQKLKVSARLNVGFWHWELEHLPSYWRYAFSFYDEIWASTRFTYEAFALERLRPVRLMPVAVMAPESPREISRRELNLPADTVVFLFVFDFRSFASRKNPEAVVRAFRQAFPTGDEPVLLLIKTMGAEENSERLTQLAELCADPRISLRDIKLDRDELIGLVKASDAFVSLHRSEGFGRAPAEAMLLGRPTILTGYSGTADFATADCAYIVDYDLVPVEPGDYPGVEGQRWAEANIATAARHMRRIYERPEEARRIGKQGAAQVARLLGTTVIGSKMRDALLELLDRAERDRAPGRRSRATNKRGARSRGQPLEVLGAVSEVMEKRGGAVSDLFNES